MQSLFRQQSQPSQPSRTLTFSFNDRSPEKSSYLELDLLSSPPLVSSKSAKFPNQRNSITKVQGTLEALDAPQSPKFMSHRAHTLQIFKSSLHQDKERDAKQKRTALREFIKRTDSPTIVNNLLDRGKKDVTTKKTKDKNKGIMFINELWANKYEKKTIKAAQLDKELLQLDTHYLQTAKRQAGVRMFEKKKTMTIDSSGQLCYQMQTEPDNEIKLLHKESQSTEPEFLVRSHREGISGHRRDCSLPYLVQLQTDTSLHRGMSDPNKHLPIVKFSKVASSPGGVVEVSEHREDEERFSPQSNFLLGDNGRLSPISELMNKSIRKESLLKSPKQKKSPNLKISLNQVLTIGGSESPNMSPLTLSPKTKKHVIEKHMRLNSLIDQCTNELGDKEDIVSGMVKLRKVFVSPKANVLKKIEATTKANMVQSCRHALEMRTKMEKSLTQA